MFFFSAVECKQMDSYWSLYKAQQKNRFYIATIVEQILDVVPFGSWGRKTTGKIIHELK